MMDLITCLDHPAPAHGDDRVLLVMLPGAGMEAGEFASRGMVAAVQADGRLVDVIAAGPELGLYLDGDIAAVLHRAVIEPALAQGYSRIWLLGISLGGMGALLYASHYAAQLEGLILLAPFLGTQGTIAEIEASGGLASWPAAASAATKPERRMLAWLQDFIACGAVRPAIYLGYGNNDRFALGHRMLGEALPACCVVTEPGGHDWETWLLLCRRVLDAAPIGLNIGGVR